MIFFGLIWRMIRNINLFQPVRNFNVTPKIILNVTALTLTAMFLWGCQPKSKQDKEIEQVHAKGSNVALKYSQSCDLDGCTEYHFKTVKTGVSWLDDYFLQRIKRSEPNAFTQSVQMNLPAQVKKIIHQRSVVVASVGQWGKLASFSIETRYDTKNKRKNMYFKEYVNFDLAQEKRISIEDVLKPNQEKKLLAMLYKTHRDLLKKHQIKAENLRLSDNFYYQKQAIVFVYPIEELNLKQKGMAELELPYRDAKALIKAEYFPTLP